jgi:uncharacterized protein YbjT (DUF2867 family)
VAADVVTGSILRTDILERCVHGQDAVISCLGLRRAGISPWSKLLSPRDLVSSVVGSLVRLMDEANVRKLIMISAGGVGSSRDSLSAGVRRMIGFGNLRVAYEDLDNAERRVIESGIDASVVRPVTLIRGPVTERAGRVERYGMLSAIRRSDVAWWIVRELERGGTGGVAPILLGTVSAGRTCAGCKENR